MDPAAEPDNGMAEYYRLQRKLQQFTLVLSGMAVLVTALLLSWSTAFAVLVGATAALLYLRLLGRSVSRLGGERRGMGKAQLLVPILLVLAACRLPQLDLLPAFLGFLLYKPAVILQAVLDA
ncbi:ATP synthase protein I [Cyanobium sp. NS01]|nr:ATP synthase protein I [Cyanobium sp. NS01]